MRVLVVGQTPPPWGGQAVMIQQLLNAELFSVRFCHVRMAFSENMNEIGRFKLQKLWHLILVIFRIFLARLRYRPSVLYYPPAGPNRVPFYRDAAILILTRWMFKRTVFHFHASGISTLYPSLNWVEKRLFDLAYRKPDASIRTSALNPDDASFLNAKRNVVIQNGLPDVFPRFKKAAKNRNLHSVPRILFVGALYESKGIRVLIEACGLLKLQGHAFELVCVGRFETATYESKIKALVDMYRLNGQAAFPGVLTGDAKWEAYARSNIFCFPSYFESESFGLVNLEAMQFELPVVSTRWRGIPSVVKDRETGFLTGIRNPQQIAEKLAILLQHIDIRAQMGCAGRRIFLEQFSAAAWSEKMTEVFRMISEDS